MRIGSRIGVFEVAGPLGAGGMGEVYRARDTRLGRDVALKVLPVDWAADADRRARFDREARVLASLNHPNIATLYGVEDSPAGPVLVMELVDGTTLADRLALGDHFPLAEALAVARQAATALQAAHERGIIHRDLKPANIVLRADGTVKVLDFGLAKALDLPADGSDPPQPTVTQTNPHGGFGPGTPPYMSPEQARGLPADTRADIWAFGCVLYELLTGQRAFAGDHTSDVVARILERDPDLSLLPPDTPAAVRRLLRRCLEKNPQNRLRDIGDARLEIDEAERADVDINPQTRRGHHARWAVIVLALLTPAVVFFGIPATPVSDTVTRTAIVFPPGQELDLGLRAQPLALSPDGNRVAFVAERDGQQQLYFRRLSDLEATAVPGTSGAAQPFFSPNGEWVAFFARGALWRVTTDGHDPVQICAVTGATFGGSWATSDTIVFATQDAGLNAVAPSGGIPVRIPGSETARWPEVLPDGDTVLYIAGVQRISSITLAGSKRRVLATTSDDDAEGLRIGPGQLGPVRYVPSGHLLFGHGAFRVRAMNFDRRSLTLTGSPVSIADSVYRSALGGVYFAVSQRDVLIYFADDPRRRLVWVDRSGTVTPVAEGEEAFRYPELSPDGSRIAVNINTPERRSDVWVYDSNRRTRTRLTADRHSLLPVWNRTGTHVTFSPGSLVTRAADGTGAENVTWDLAELADASWLYPTSWSRDGRDLLFTTDSRTNGTDLWVLSQDSRPTVRPLLVRPFNEQWAEFSPDGQWVAYSSNESGVDEVYVARYPGLENRIVVSTSGGDWPVWSRDGRELFYRRGTAMMAATIETAPSLKVGAPVQLFTGPFVGVDGDPKFDVSPDGRFLMVMRASATGPHQLVVVQNWHEELKQTAPADGQPHDQMRAW